MHAVPYSGLTNSAAAWTELGAAEPPQLGTFTGSPKPRKLKLASAMMTLPTLMLKMTISGAAIVGQHVANQGPGPARANRLRRSGVGVGAC